MHPGTNPHPDNASTVLQCDDDEDLSDEETAPLGGGDADDGLGLGEDPLLPSAATKAAAIPPNALSLPSFPLSAIERERERERETF